MKENRPKNLSYILILCTSIVFIAYYLYVAAESIFVKKAQTFEVISLFLFLVMLLLIAVFELVQNFSGKDSYGKGLILIGQISEKHEMVKRMNLLSYTVEQISEITNMSVEDIELLLKELNNTES